MRYRTASGREFTLRHHDPTTWATEWLRRLEGLGCSKEYAAGVFADISSAVKVSDG